MQFMNLHIMGLLVIMTSLVAGASRPNVIFIAVDDWNDWTTPLGSGMAKTPNLERLAAMGVTFENAHTAGIYCAPSRSAVFTGRYATTTGVYSDQIYFYDKPELRPLQKAFQDGGYQTYGTGKLYHHPAGCIDLRGWDDFHVRNEDQKKSGWAMDSWKYGAPLPDPYPASKFNQANKKWKGKPFMEVGAIPDAREDEMADSMRANWAVNIIKQKHKKPFFLAVGFYAPHFPNYAPQKYFDLYALDEIKRPEWKDDDLDDIPLIMRKRHEARKRNIHQKLLDMGIVESTIRGYLASISYADAMLGRLLDALEASACRDNTIIIFWSDHGYAHGQKGHWGKHTLWERTSNVPFMIAGPGIKGGARTSYTTSLIDMYPTLIELCGLSGDSGLDGESLKPILERPTIKKERTVLLPFDVPGSFALINKSWRYIQYKDGSLELYDLAKDPHEWENLAMNPKYEKMREKIAARAPKLFAPAGTSKKTLRMVADGETFKWEPKRGNRKKKK